MRRVPDDEMAPEFRAKVQRVRSMVDFYWGDF